MRRLLLLSCVVYGLLFLGLALTVRLEGRMSPVTRYAVDFALPVWIALRSLLAVLRRVEERGSKEPSKR